jgi:hypothetical protein
MAVVKADVHMGAVHRSTEGSARGETGLQCKITCSLGGAYAK